MPHLACDVGGLIPAISRRVAYTGVATMLGNVKTAIRGTYHAVAAKHLLRYLAEFSYSICQRYIAGMLPLPAASQTPPCHTGW